MLRGFNTCTPGRETEVWHMVGCVILMLLTVGADDNIDQSEIALTPTRVEVQGYSPEDERHLI